MDRHAATGAADAGRGASHPEREDLNLYVFANMLNTTARALRRWEQGLNRPTGPALRLLHAIRDKGMAIVFPLLD